MRLCTGYTDENLKNFTRHSKEHEFRKCPSYVRSGIIPDIWIEPNSVWEIAAADLSLSPTYPAGIGYVSDERGISLRFPRFIRIREDKSIENATTVRELVQAYRSQRFVIDASTSIINSCENNAVESGKQEADLERDPISDADISEDELISSQTCDPEGV